MTFIIDLLEVYAIINL